MKLRTFVVFFIGFLTLSAASLPLASAAKGARRASAEEFFIISSIDKEKKQLVLKRPTEVTELMRVSVQTEFVDEEGKSLHFNDLRAGDTVYVTSLSQSAGPPIATRIRRGIMTVEEIHRRYLPY